MVLKTVGLTGMSLRMLFVNMKYFLYFASVVRAETRDGVFYFPCSASTQHCVRTHCVMHKYFAERMSELMNKRIGTLGVVEGMNILSNLWP